MRVLLVDDHQDTLDVLAILVERCGFDVVRASTMGSALEVADASEIDLLVSDLGLPDGTGWELLETLRSRQSVVGIALSGYGMPGDLDRSRASGFVTHIVKPVSKLSLQDALEAAVEQLRVPRAQ